MTDYNSDGPKKLCESFLDGNISRTGLSSPDDLEKFLNSTDGFKALYTYLCLIPTLDTQLDFARILLATVPCAYKIYNQLGNQLFTAGLARNAAAFYGEAVRLKPGYSHAMKRKGNALRVVGEIEEAVKSYRDALAIAPDPASHSRMLLAMHFENCWLPAEIAAEHFAWGDQHDPAIEKKFSAQQLQVNKTPLTVGYISPDFKSHPVAYFIQPIIENHDRSRVHVICYATTHNNDGVSRRIKKICGLWREVQGMPVDELTELIRQDGVDILVDLAGHTSGNRLDVFTRRPAPLQLTYLGYPNGTGLRSMDYRITDSVSDPPVMSESWYREKLLRIDPIFLCFEPPEGGPEVVASPCLDNGFVTFGSFNKFSKLSRNTIAAWSMILEAVPNARLLLKTRGLENREEKQRALACFSEAGLRDPSRIEILDLVPSRTEHLRLYGRIDIALDPFPYNGTTNTCQSLWMGVPVVTLKGTHHVARVGASILEQMGLERFVAKSLDDYIGIATYWARHPNELATLRTEIRPRLKGSSLLDHAGFTRKLETTYQTIWSERCALGNVS